MELTDPGIDAARIAEAVSFRCLEPMSPVGLGRGRFEFCALPHPQFLTTGGVELTSLASIARARVTRSVSSLMGMIKWNLGSSFMTGSA